MTLQHESARRDDHQSGLMHTLYGATTPSEISQHEQLLHGDEGCVSADRPMTEVILILTQFGTQIHLQKSYFRVEST